MKAIKSILIVLLVCLTLGNSVFASACVDIPTPTALADENVSPCAEETEWYYRNNNGVLEKRLWSITYGVWLTEWIYVRDL